LGESRGGAFTPDMHWPYDFQAAEQRLQLKDITDQGEFFLKRSLNIDRTVAFVGSGVSAAYGRVSWGELATLQIEGINAAFDPLFETDPNDPELRHVKGFVDLLKSFQPRVRDEDGDTITQAMQIAEQVWTMAGPGLLGALNARFSFKKRTGKAKAGDDVPTDGAKRFREIIMQETHDETMHVKRILSWTFEGYKDDDSINAFVRDNIRPPDLRRFPVNGKTREVHKIFARATGKDRLISSIATVAQELRGLPEANGRGPEQALHRSSRLAAEFALQVANLLHELRAKSRMISPIHYYAVGLAIDLLRFACAGEQRDRLKTIRDALKENYESKEPISRQDVIAPNDDPLLVVQRGLKIKRFVTTNYDLEIERMFEHLGFGRTHYSAQDELPEDEVERVGNLGTRSREIVLQDKSGADFIDFAAGNGPYYAQVLHIHGRATRGDDVVITERDYQHAYVGEERRHVTAREGFEILFGGNPVVFLGLGLSEGDVMRPLREFAADNIRRNTSVVALKPATDSEAKRNAFTLGQYVRHRLYVLHYGIKTKVDGTPRDKDEKDEPRDPSWLAPLNEFMDSLSNMIRYLTTDLPGQTADERQIDIDSLKAAIVKKRNMLPDFLRDESFSSDGDQCTVTFELKLLEIISELLNSLAKVDPSTLPKGDYPKSILEILRRAVARTKNAILTRALTARLRSIETQWQKWSGSWFATPEERLSDRWNNTGRTTPILPHDADVLKGPKDAPLWAPIRELYRARWYRQVFAEPPSITDVVKKFAEAGIKSLIEQKELPLAEDARHFVVTAARGDGKGTAFSELTTYGDFLLNPSGFDDPVPSQRIPKTRYAAQFAATFSFSSEIASVWDALTAFLQAPMEKSKVTMESWRHDGLGRIGRLGRALDEARDRAIAVKAKLDEDKTNQQEARFEVAPRFLVVLHAVDLLFDKAVPKTAEIAPKTAEIAEIFKTIAKAKRCSIDWVLICASEAPLWIKNNLTHTEPFKLDPWRKKATLPAAVDNGRFLTTLYKLVERDQNDSEHGREKFAKDIALSANSRGQPSYDGIIHGVLTYWRERSFPKGDRLRAERRHIWASLGGETSRRNNLLRGLKAAENFSLQEVIIRHLAVISVPVDARVLARSNEVRRRACAALGLPTNETRDGADTPKLWDRVVKVIELALAVLCSRGLAFRFFTPYEKRKIDDDAERALIQRYQVHRLVQLYIYRRLGSQNVEPANAFFFSVSLYAAQARDLPTLSANSYAFLSDLVDQLIDYPSRDGKKIHYPFDFTDASRCLRAALGIARTLFSIGVVARFADLGEMTIPHPPRVGYFEHRRLVLRWMIMRAADLDRRKQELAKNAEPAGQPTESDDDPKPFYRDEIVWLYNECGVFSLSQGQCFDAHGLFRFAQKKAKEIEGGKETGPIGRRILTNLGACEINRGRLPRARQMFDRVEREERDDETIRYIARGYLALICHVEGSIAEARSKYDDTIADLKKIGRSRATGLFLCFRAELFRHLNDPSNAEKDLEDALDFARRSGYEDMARFAVVGIARLRASNAQTSDVPSIIRSLDEAEKYAEAMDIALLRCEISYARAIILLKQGEHTRAGREATRAIRTATLSGLALRALAYRNLLADVHLWRGRSEQLSRGWSEQGERMKKQIREEARNIGYRLLLQRMSKTAELPRRSAVTDLSRSSGQGATGS
jgi:tetratricopeptide (TPR) repeat protein